jgi:hypothetical protein
MLELSIVVFLRRVPALNYAASTKDEIVVEVLPDLRVLYCE